MRFNLLWGWRIGLASSSIYIWCVQTKGLMPFKSDISHSIAFLHLLRTSSRHFSWGLVRDEDITIGHCLFSSRYVYFNSMGRGFKLSFGISSVVASYASSLLNKCRISSLLLQPCRAASTSEGSSNPSSRSPRLSFNLSCIFWLQCSSTRVSMIHTSSRPPSSSGVIGFLDI